MPWPKGVHNPKPPNSGRRKGTPNKATLDIKHFALSILEDPAYQRKLKARILAGTAGKIEELMYFYAYGKPVDNLKLSGSVSLAQLVSGQELT